MPPEFAFPRALRSDPEADFDDRFGTEVESLLYLMELRWEKRFRCTTPTCKSTEAWLTEDLRWSCAGCRQKVSVTAGTILDRQRIQIRSWLAVAWYITSRSIPVGAADLRRELHLTYQTARTVLHKLRTAMRRSAQRPLRGPVEVAVIYLRQGKQGVLKPRIRGRFPIAIAVGVSRKKGLGRLHLCRIQDNSDDGLVSFVCDVVKPGAEVRTVRPHNSLYERGYNHVRVGHSANSDSTRALLLGVGKVALELEKWLGWIQWRRPLQKSITASQLDYYLYEFAFRFNSDDSGPNLLFERLVKYALATPPTPLRASRAGQRK